METNKSVCRVLITGANGLLGYHARAAILAENCAADFNNEPHKYKLVESPRLTPNSKEEWLDLVSSANLVLHLAGINRAEPEEVENGNRVLAELLVSVLSDSGSRAHVVYANSTHANTDTPYGRGKEKANRIFQEWADTNSTSYTNVVLPHIFGEKARPHYNNVTGTLCQQVFLGEEPTINEGAKVELLHAATAVDHMLFAFTTSLTGTSRLSGTHISVKELYELLLSFQSDYQANVFPNLSDSFKACLFNAYRTLEYPGNFPKELKLHSDERGVLFEAVKGGGGGQSFLSWTGSGVERGNHFHRQKIERFLVISGSAEIRIRPLFEDRIDVFVVSGDEPAYIDIPTLHTHSIVNTGTEPLLTLFWTHEIFDPDSPDTFAHLVSHQ